MDFEKKKILFPKVNFLFLIKSFSDDYLLNEFILVFKLIKASYALNIFVYSQQRQKI